jgi:hypothetical protein
MWRRWAWGQARGERGADGRGDDTGSESDPAGSVSDECEAYLAGQLSAYLIDRGRPVPPYAWLNQVAHATPTELAVIAAGNPQGVQPKSWRRAAAYLAESLLRLAHDSGRPVAELQRELLVPLEIELAGDSSSSEMESADIVRLAFSRFSDFRGSPG